MDKFEPEFLYLELELPPVVKKDTKEKQESNYVVIDIFDSDKIITEGCYNGIQII